jgi:hypothetical protein
VKGLIAAGANINMSSSDEASQTASSSAGAKDLLTSYPNQLHAKVHIHNFPPAVIFLDYCVTLSGHEKWW